MKLFSKFNLKKILIPSFLQNVMKKDKMTYLIGGHL